VEEDARLTALFLWTLQSTNGNGASKDAQEPSEEEKDEEDEEEEKPKGRARGFSLVFDVVRRFAQPLGINLPVWEGRIIETKKGIVRLLSVAERADQLFGKEGARSVAYQLENEPKAPPQLLLFKRAEDEVPKVRGRGQRRVRESAQTPEMATGREATTLDRVHAAMLLQAGGMTNALRALIKAEIEGSPDFLRLANALSALYPRESEEKRLLDAMLLAVPR
jgi:putative DNA methylase